jgi:hypothetical protein
MPGQSKVNGAWKTITGLSVKVGGQWKTATSGYIKVGGAWKQWFASKIQDAFNRASTATGLGTADSGQVWDATRGNWRISGSNSAISDDAAANYPLASINLGNTDVKIQTDTTGGVGPAFWVTDSGSWWASYPRFTSVTNTFCDQGFVSEFNNPPAVNCCSPVVTGSVSVCDQTQVTNQSNPPSSSCCSGVTTSGGGTACTGNQVTNTSNPPSASCCSTVTQGGGGTSTVCDQSQVTNTNNPPSNSCCSGVTQGGGGQSNVCDQGQVTNSSNPPSNQCCSGVSQGGGGTTPVCDQGRVDTYGFGCPAGSCAGEFSETVNSSYCSGGVITSSSISGLSGCCDIPVESPGSTTTTCRLINLFSQYCNEPGYSGETQQKTCNGTTAGANYSYCAKTTTTSSTWSCNTTTVPFTYTQYYCYTSTRNVTNPTTYSCYTSTRLVNNPITYSCYTSTRSVNNPITYSCYTSQVVQPTFYSCFTATRNRTTYSCYTSTRSVTTYTSDLVLVSSVSGTVAVASTLNLATNTSGFSTVGSVYVTTVGSVVTSSAYSGSNLTGSQVGSTLSYTATNPTKGTSVGIIKGPSTGSQGSTTDNFLATI